MNPKEKKVKKKMKLDTKLTTKKKKVITYVIENLIMSLDQESPGFWKVNNDTNPNNSYPTTPPSDNAAAATIATSAVSSTTAVAITVQKTPNDAYITTPHDGAAAAAAIIASTAIVSTNVIAITGQKTAGAALAAAAAAAKAIQLPTTIDADINDKGTAATKITQDQATEIYRIQKMLDKYATSIIGMCSYLQKHVTAYDILSTEDNGNDIDTSKETASTVGTMCPSTVTGEESTRYISSSLETTKSVLMDKEGTTTQVCSPVTGEESTRYISSLLETTKSVLMDKEATTTQVREVSLMSPPNSDAHTDPAFYRSSSSHKEEKDEFSTVHERLTILDNR